MCSVYTIDIPTLIENLTINIQEHGRGCCSTCCSGAFIVETMACVIVNDQVKECAYNINTPLNTTKQGKNNQVATKIFLH